MEIYINQQKFSFGDKYEIFTDGQFTHNATKKVFQIFPEIELFDAGGQRRMLISKLHSWIDLKYDLTRWDNNLIEFRTRSAWRNHFQCQAGNQFYELFGHKGRKYSIFRNDVQVGWWTKNAVTYFDGDQYTITCDNDADVDMMISLCLIIDNAKAPGGNNVINVDLGNLLQARKFDEGWQPKW